MTVDWMKGCRFFSRWIWSDYQKLIRTRTHQTATINPKINRTHRTKVNRSAQSCFLLSHPEQEVEDKHGVFDALHSLHGSRSELNTFPGETVRSEPAAAFCESVWTNHTLRVSPGWPQEQHGGREGGVQRGRGF